MSVSMSFFRNYKYEVCLAKGSVWTVAEAVDILATYLTNKESWYATADAHKAFPFIRFELFTAARKSIETGSLPIHEEYAESGDGEGDVFNYVLDFNRSTVSAVIFINWAIDNNIKVPKQFLKYAVNKSDKPDYYEGLGIKRTSIHHERCRAIAELLWSQEPEIEIAKMAQRAEITDFGCEGYPYDVRTICRWLASLIPDRRPGRRKKV